jgi:hypothetical protein
MNLLPCQPRKGDTSTTLTPFPLALPTALHYLLPLSSPIVTKVFTRAPLEHLAPVTLVTLVDVTLLMAAWHVKINYQ